MTMLDARCSAPLVGGTFVYMLKVQDFVKIGISANWKKRLNNIQTASPFVVEVLHVEINHPDFEAKLHKRFEASHHRGEWFRATPDLMAYAARRSEICDIRIRPDITKPQVFMFDRIAP